MPTRHRFNFYRTFTTVLVLIFFLAPSMKPILRASPLAKSPNNHSSLPLNTASLTLDWKRSPVWTGNQAGPQDANGRYWNEPAFDDAAWTTVSLPDSAPDISADDRYYLAHFNWDGISTVSTYFVSDDGLSIFVNGSPLGTWGNGWRQSGCINAPPTCINYTDVPIQTVPTSMLRVGDNVIAIDLWNATPCFLCFVSYAYLDVVVNVAGPTFSISGRVTDISNNPIPDVIINDGATQTTKTDSNGNYTLNGLVAGTYTLNLSKGSYCSAPLELDS